MAMTTSSIAQEIQQIANTGVKPVHFNWTAEIEANNQIIQVLNIQSIDLDRQYHRRYSDYILVDATLPMGTYLNQIFPYKSNLVMTLRKAPKGEMNSALSVASSSGIENHRMRATIMSASNHQLEGNTPFIQDTQTANITNLIRVEFQLLDLALEQIRMKRAGTIMRKTTPGDAVKFFLTALTKDIKVDANNQVKGVQMVDPDNKQTRDHVIIPQKLDFSEVPGWVHEHMGGIYNGGFGHYLQSNVWHVYPLFNTTRWTSTPNNLTLLNVPANQMPGADRTYRLTNNQVIAVLTGNNKHIDDTESQLLNEGNGLRFTSASKMLDGFVSVTGNKATAARVDNNTEFVANQRETGLNNLPFSPEAITDNNFFQMSKMARRLGTFLQVTWENSNPDLIYPAMPVRYAVEIGGQVQETYGCVVAAHHYIRNTSMGLVGSNFTNTSALTLFLDTNGANSNAPTAASGTLQGAVS